MSKFALAARCALGVFVLALAIAPLKASAAEPGQATGAAPTPAPEPVLPPGFTCNDKPVTGSGPGFDSSRDHSEQTAKEAWLGKATAIYADATWQTAKRLDMTCVKQGLYSKCFASAVPCGAKKSSAAAEPTKGN